MHIYANTEGDRGAKGKGSNKKLTTRFTVGNKDRSEAVRVEIERLDGDVYHVEIKTPRHNVTDVIVSK